MVTIRDWLFQKKEAFKKSAVDISTNAAETAKDKYNKVLDTEVDDIKEGVKKVIEEEKKDIKEFSNFLINSVLGFIVFYIFWALVPVGFIWISFFVVAPLLNTESLMNIPAFLITVGVSIGLSIFFYLKANTRVYRIASVLGLSTGFAYLYYIYIISI